MIPARHNFQIWKGGSVAKRYRLNGRGVDGTIEPVDLTGCNIEYIINGSTTLTLVEGDGLTITPLEGAIDVRLTADQTEQFNWSRANYTLFVRTATDDYPFVQGTIRALHN